MRKLKLFSKISFSSQPNLTINDIVGSFDFETGFGVLPSSRLKSIIRYLFK